MPRLLVAARSDGLDAAAFRPTYLTDISQIGAVREVRDEYLDTQRPPASTVVEVRRLVQEEFLIEVEAVARS